MPVGTTPNPRGSRKTAATRNKRTQDAPGAKLIDPERRRALIAEAAYFRAQRRGFEPGHETEDWLAAEMEIDMALTVGVSNNPS